MELATATHTTQANEMATSVMAHFIMVETQSLSGIPMASAMAIAVSKITIHFQTLASRIQTLSYRQVKHILVLCSPLYMST